MRRSSASRPSSSEHRCARSAHPPIPSVEAEHPGIETVGRGALQRSRRRFPGGQFAVVGHHHLLRQRIIDRGRRRHNRSDAAGEHGRSEPQRLVSDPDLRLADGTRRQHHVGRSWAAGEFVRERARTQRTVADEHGRFAFASLQSGLVNLVFRRTGGPPPVITPALEI